jgi:hypothetical protein
MRNTGPAHQARARSGLGGRTSTARTNALEHEEHDIHAPELKSCRTRTCLAVRKDGGVVAICARSNHRSYQLHVQAGVMASEPPLCSQTVCKHPLARACRFDSRLDSIHTSYHFTTSGTPRVYTSRSHGRALHLKYQSAICYFLSQSISYDQPVIDDANSRNGQQEPRHTSKTSAWEHDCAQTSLNSNRFCRCRAASTTVSKPGSSLSVSSAGVSAAWLGLMRQITRMFPRRTCKPARRCMDCFQNGLHCVVLHKGNQGRVGHGGMAVSSTGT